MIWDRLRRESNTKAQSLMFECVCVCLIQNKNKKIIVSHCFRECIYVCFSVRLIPSPLLVCVIVSKKKKKLTKNQNDRIIAFGKTNIIVNKRIVKRLWTKKEKNFDFASPFFSLISIFMSKRNLKKKLKFIWCAKTVVFY